ncbi:Alpha/Beta hydrolase protein [Emericellopsis atlantica]|uniref:Alpha/Beta hydrolase protein n=1 Tax=Emericellopsis atlantica TaxID=2614577 RepID=A0A9P7ZU60_9HYPO|nr:Alpha/Beta hydrolase protein [Emericellopsis atlantica]KAG9258424.1 Alpha/Beta hydrolase protein [Emericellopsis atlantica]
MHLPDPTLTLTIPSIHDSLPLNCRIYHPLEPDARYAAVVAHPYAPLGGSYDDPIVETVAAYLLRRGFIVATFNFRGAGTGRTSWSARPEVGDYTSIVGFIVYYVHHLFHGDGVQGAGRALLMGGYSYGAMVTSQLPPLEDLLLTFATPAIDSAAAQIRSQADTLAAQQRDVLHARSRRSLRVGEGSPKRRSNDSARSHSFSLDEAEDKIRHLVNKTVHRRENSRGQPGSTNGAASVTLAAVPDLTLPRPAYLLISPLQGFVLSLATMRRHTGDEAAEQKMRGNPTLAVFGNGDIFVAASKLRTWVTRMEDGDSLFQGQEVEGAGHFWVEQGVLSTMMSHVANFVRMLTAP